MAGQRVHEVLIERLRFGLSPRVHTSDPNHVAALAEVLDKVPPIVVHEATMRVIDGVHRVLAARAVGRATIPAVMFAGDETAVLIEAVRRNVMHGKPLALAEREAAAVRIIEEVPSWSDRRIAAVSGLSPKTVARLRQRATVDVAQPRARLGRDGRLRPTDPGEVRQRVAEALRSDPEASNRAVARQAGASPATVRDVRQRLERGESELPPPAPSRPHRPRGRAAEAKNEPNGERRTEVVPDDFATWFDQRHLDDRDWGRFVDRIPISRVYEVADACRSRGDSWRAFAAALEDRARARRRSPNAQP
jgi:ParB-like chromosome segregation protein Spo0J